MKYYYLYKITNLVNGRIYIGVHRTKNLNDGYMGSGIKLSEAKEKYGTENFEKEILKYFDTEEEMLDEEAEIVDKDFIKREDTYNICYGGKTGSWDFCNEQGLNLYGRHGEFEGIPTSKLGIDKLREIYGDDWPRIVGEKGSKAVKELYPEGTMKGKKQSDDAKRKIGEKNSQHQKGSGNSQYGTMWIYNPELEQNKKIKKDEPIPEGWYKGRKKKFHKK